jgi:spore coat polysaccharide biosynthesis protein SpsF (cytidylyltransferase family)
MQFNRTAIFITARLGSKRLPDKHIIDMGGIKPIEILIRRLKKIQLPIVLTTGDEEINQGFKEICKKEDIEIFFGHMTNIPLRHLQAAKELNYDFILSIDGDDILTAPEGIEKLLNNLTESPGYFHTEGYPFGMNSGGYSRKFLEESLTNHRYESLETGWGRIFPKDSFIPVFCVSKNADNWRLSLDYKEDFLAFKKIWDHFQNNLIITSTEEILDYFSKQEVWKLNASVIENYWANFKSEKEKEIDKENNCKGKV